MGASAGFFGSSSADILNQFKASAISAPRIVDCSAGGIGSKYFVFETAVVLSDIWLWNMITIGRD